MSTDFKQVLVVLLAVLAGAVVGNRFGPGWRGSDEVERQRLNLAVAEEKLPEVEARLRADEQFRDVQAGLHTGQGGGAMLTGWVQTDADLFRLMQAVADERLPVAVFWQVKVAERK
jgi:hypothetical protein